MGRSNQKNKGTKVPQTPDYIMMLGGENISDIEAVIDKIMEKRKQQESIEKGHGLFRTLNNDEEVRENCRRLIKNEQKEYERQMIEYKKNCSPFKCTLNEAQMKLLFTFFNEHLIEEAISLEELEDIFMGKGKGATYRLKDWKLFILLFKGLSGKVIFPSDKRKNVQSFFVPIQGHHYICDNWQKGIEDLKGFLNENGDNLTAQRIARQLNKIGDGERRMPEKVKILRQLFEQLVALE